MKLRFTFTIVSVLSLSERANAFGLSKPSANLALTRDIQDDAISNLAKTAASFALCGLLSLGAATAPAIAAEGAQIAGNAKITTGGASTLQSGRTIAITRGVNLDRSDFGGQNLRGVAFQQSIVRDTNFKGTNLVGSSFFDATVDGSNFEDADLSLANVEMAQFARASLKVRFLK